MNEVLFKNDLVNATVLLMAKREVTLLESQLCGAREETKTAQAYFNFLLNRNLGEAIVTEMMACQIADIAQMDPDIPRREELLQLKAGQEISQNVLKLNRSLTAPKVSAFLDLGSQGFDWQPGQKKTSIASSGWPWSGIYSASETPATKSDRPGPAPRYPAPKTSQVQNQLQLQLTTAYNLCRAATFQYTA